MAVDDGGERTEQPTARRRLEAVERGELPRSSDLSAAVVMLAGLILLSFFGHGMLTTMMGLVRRIELNTDGSTGDALVWIYITGAAVVRMLLPFLILLVLISVAGTSLQSGIHLTWKRLTPNLNKLNPITGVKRLFSTDALVRLGMGVMKMTVVTVVAWFSISVQIPFIVGLTGLSPPGVFGASSEIIYNLALRLCLVLLLLAFIDYFYQRWSVNKKLKMTKQEVKDEHKRMEGDPTMKQRRRQTQFDLALQRIGMDVPKADVVVTNPTEYAVALRYDEQMDAAPRVLAKGVDFVALRIRQVAQQNGVPIVQRPPLARALYAACDPGQEVPVEHYRAVAEVLAYVYQLAGRAGALGGVKAGAALGQEE